MTKNKHPMSTRSKKSGSNPPPKDDLDERGNIGGLIDYSEDTDFDKGEYQSEIFKLSNGKMGKKKSPKKKHPRRPPKRIKMKDQ